MTKNTKAASNIPTAVTPPPASRLDVGASIKKQREDGEALLKRLGYRKSDIAPPTWRTLVEHALHCMFLEKKNRWQRKGKNVEHDLVHRIHFPTEGLAELFVATLQRKHPGFSDVVVLKPVEMLGDREIEIRHRVLMTPATLVKVVCDIDLVARIYLGQYQSWSTPSKTSLAADADLSARLRNWDIRPERRLRMRLEFLADVMTARLALSAYVCRWTDIDSESSENDGKTRSVTTLMGHDVELELADGSPTLDQLRWLLWQIPDMHVAAESLNYAHLYTGDRLSYEYFERMQPSEEVIVAMTRTSLRMNGFLSSLTSLFGELQKTLKANAPIGTVFGENEEADDVAEGEALEP